MSPRLAWALHPLTGARRVPPRLRSGLVALAVIVVLAAAALVGLRLARAGAVLPGVHVGDVDVGGATEAELADLVAGADRAGDELTVVAHQRRVSVDVADLGYELDRAATARAAMARGRQPNPLAALIDHLRAFGGTLTVAPRVTVDEPALADRAARLARRLSRDPVEGSLTFSGATFERVQPADGWDVDAAAVARAVRPALTGAEQGPVRVGAEPVAPETTPAAVDALAAQARRALAEPVTLTRGDVTWRVTPEELGTVLQVERDGDELALTADPDAVASLAGDVADAVSREAVDADVRVTGGSPEVVASRTGFAFDAEAAAEQLVEVATGGGDRSARLRGEVLEPELTTAEAEALDISERVSSFTTHFTAGQSRVQNIRRIAEIVDGALLEPGESLGLNEHVGPRTRAKGFTAGGAIFDGEFVTDVGGGVSQFATTMYNAAYFGGYAIPEFKPHSYYISRYPVGREATIDYPSVELRVRNNSPHGLLVTTSSTPTSVTVSMWGTTWVEVDSEAGPRRDVTPAPVERRPDRDLPPGAERVAQSGRAGFTITVTRVLRFPDGSVEREPVTTRYHAQPRIIEVGPAPAEDAAGGDGPAASASPAPQDAGGAAQ